MHYISLIAGFQEIIGSFLFAYTQYSIYKYEIKFKPKNEIDLPGTQVFHNIISFNIIATGFFMQIYGYFITLVGNIIVNFIILGYVDVVLGLSVFGIVLRRHTPGLAELIFSCSECRLLLFVLSILVYPFVGFMLVFQHYADVGVVGIGVYLLLSSFLIYYHFVKLLLKYERKSDSNFL